MARMRLAGVLAAAVSALLLVVVLARDVGLNVLNGWTIALGFGAAALLLRQRQPGAAAPAGVALIAAMAPAMFGGVGLLYLPSLVLALAGTAHAPSIRP